MCFTAKLEDDILRIGNITSGLTPFVPNKSDPWDALKAMHLLRRTGFGFKYADVAILVDAGSPSAAVDIILNIDNTVPKPPVNWYQTYNATSADAGGVAYGADWTNNAFTNVDAATTLLQQRTNSYRNSAVRQWMFGLALNQDITIKEKMTWFWYHFLPIDFETITSSSNNYIKTNSARIFYSYFKMFRDNAGGNFKTIIRNMATHPAMMYYLNNQANSAAAPDENFARELMELFTLGKDPLSQYTQADVVAAAQVLTGWRVQNLNTEFRASKYGLAMRATAFNQQVAQSLGISVKNVFAMAWAISAMVSAVAGVVVAVVNGVSSGLSAYGIKVFPAAILGGLDSIGGAVVGGIIIGLLENIAQYVDSEYLHWGNLYEIAPFYVLIIILMIKPYGLFGTKDIERV